MCDSHMDTANWIQYHPVLQNEWNQYITTYQPRIIPTKPLIEKPTNKQSAGGWDDPYKNIRPMKIVDFFRGFELTK